MERLTHRNIFGTASYAEKPVGEFPQMVVNKLAGFEDAEADGRLLVLPEGVHDDVKKKLHELMETLEEYDAVGLICIIL